MDKEDCLCQLSYCQQNGEHSCLELSKRDGFCGLARIAASQHEAKAA